MSLAAVVWLGLLAWCVLALGTAYAWSALRDRQKRREQAWRCCGQECADCPLALDSSSPRRCWCELYDVAPGMCAHPCTEEAGR